MTSYRRIAVGVLLFSLAVRAAAPTTAPAMRPTDLLGVRLGTVRASGTPLDDLIDTLRDGSQRNIFVNWRALKSAGIPRDLPVTIDLSGMTLDAAVEKLLKDVGGTRVVLGHNVDGGVLTISTADDLAKNTETRTYDVRSLLDGDAAGRADRLAAAVRRVQGIDPLSWKANHGNVGDVKELGGQLIVTHTPAVQRRVAEELGLPYVASASVVEPATRPAESAVERTDMRLEKKIPVFQSDQQPLEEVLAAVAAQADVGINVDWPALDRVGVTRRSPVTTHLKNVKASKVIRTVLEGTQPGETRSADKAEWWVKDDGSIDVTTWRALYTRTVSTKRYPVDDLVRHKGPRAGVESPSADELKDEIRGLITDVIAADHWAGTPDAKPDDLLGTITFDGDTMVVKHAATVHRDIDKLLTKLRDSHPAPPSRQG